MLPILIRSYISMQENEPVPHPAANDPFSDTDVVPEEPFDIPAAYWKAGLLLFSFVLSVATVILLMSGVSSHVIGGLYVIPAILLAYFYRRKGVLVAYLLSMFMFAAVVMFRFPDHDEIFTAGLRVILLIVIALIVSYLTHHLLQEKRKYHAIFDNTENGVAVVDIGDHRIMEMNQRFRHTIGMPGLASHDLTLDRFVSDPDRIFSSLHSACTSPALETTLRRCDGSDWAAVVVGRKISGNHAVLTFVDITEKRRLDEELRQLHEDANLYLDILTHDINNINTASLNYGRLLEARAGNPAADMTASLVRSLEKSDEIIRNVSTLRRIREGNVNPIPQNLASIINQEIAMFPGVAIDYDGGTAMVLADDLLSSVFANLIGNAIKFGGSNPQIVIRVEPKDTVVEVAVTDFGPGIPDDQKQRMFERFQRGDTTVSGKGLGLYICKTLIERYGGSISIGDRVPNEPEKGVVFRFMLPKP
jgi:signal transduction histidine kinase